MEEKITISMQEYKELLQIKGKYEELKDVYFKNIITPQKENPFIWKDGKRDLNGYNGGNIQLT